MANIVDTGLVKMPDCVMRQTDDGELHAFCHLGCISVCSVLRLILLKTYLAKPFGLSVLLETESREMNTGTKDLCLGQDTNTTDTVDLHLHIWVAVGVTEVSQMRSPGSVLCVSFHNDSVFIECIGECESGLRFLPRVQIVGLLSTKPVRKRAPDVCWECQL